VDFAERSPFPSWDDLETDVYCEEHSRKR